MAMTKRERARLESILQSLERGLAFIDQRDTFIARRAQTGGAMAFERHVTAGQVQHCMRSDDPLAYEGEQFLHVIDKHIGSEFALVRNARRHLATFLNPESEG
jgi:hypothetical protein